MIENIVNNPDQIAWLALQLIGAAATAAAIFGHPKAENRIGKVLRFVRKVIDTLGLNVGNAKNKED